MASRFQFALPDPRPREGWFRVGNLDITTTALLVISGVASMFLFAISRSLFNRLAFEAVPVRNGDLWRLVTWPIANAPGLWTVIAIVFFWSVGHLVEEMVGRNRFAILMAIVTVVPAGLVSLLDPVTFESMPKVGLGLLLSVCFVIFAVENPHAPAMFGIPVWILAVVMIGINLLQLAGFRYWGTLIMTLLACGLGVAVVRQWGFATRAKFIPNLGASKPHPPRRGPAPPRSASKKTGTKRTQSRVVEGPWTAPSPPVSPADAAAAQAELDALLDKISASGLDSLTSDEKRRLNDLSKRLR